MIPPISFHNRPFIDYIPDQISLLKPRRVTMPIDAIKLIQTWEPKENPPTGLESKSDTEPLEARARASKLEYKTVDEVYAPSDQCA